LLSDLAEHHIVFNEFAGKARYQKSLLCYVSNDDMGLNYYQEIKQLLRNLPGSLHNRFKLVRRTRHSNKKSIPNLHVKRFGETVVPVKYSEYFVLYIYDKQHVNKSYDEITDFVNSPTFKSFPGNPKPIINTLFHNNIFQHYLPVWYAEQYITTKIKTVLDVINRT